MPEQKRVNHPNEKNRTSSLFVTDGCRLTAVDAASALCAVDDMGPVGFLSSSASSCPVAIFTTLTATDQCPLLVTRTLLRCFIAFGTVRFALLFDILSCLPPCRRGRHGNVKAPTLVLNRTRRANFVDRHAPLRRPSAVEQESRRRRDEALVR